MFIGDLDYREKQRLVGRVVMVNFSDENETDKMLRFLSQKRKSTFESAVSYNALKTTPSSGYGSSDINVS